MKACPFCGEMIQDAAIRCRYCQRDLNAPPGAGRSGTLLVVDIGQEIPERCVKCNSPLIKKKFLQTYSWHPPALYLLILVGILLYVVAALIVRKTIKLQVCMCEEHVRRRGKKIMTGWAIFSLSIVLMVVSGTAQFWPGFVLSWLLLFTGLIWAVSALPVLRPQKIDDRTGWLKAAGPAFLDSLPEKP